MLLNVNEILFLFTFILFVIIWHMQHNSIDVIRIKDYTNNNSINSLSKRIFTKYDYFNKKNWKKLSICLFVSFHCGSQGYISSVINNYNIFWPKFIGKKVIFLDIGSEYLETDIDGDWEVIYENYNMKGMTKKQYSAYVAYKYCNPNKFIAYMDSDSIFDMKIHKYMLFDEHEKPFFLYTYKIRHSHFNPLKLLKFNKTKWGDAMITFPIIVYTKHIEHLYRYLLNEYNNSLENIISEHHCSQFCVFLEFVRHFYRKDYHFSLYEKDPILRCALHLPYSYNYSVNKIKS